MAGKEQVRGIVHKVYKSIAEDRNIPLEITKKVAKLPLYALPDFISRGGKPKMPKHKEVWSFILEIKDDYDFPLPHMTVEMSGRKTRGVIREGDDVVVTGKLKKRRRVFVAKRLESLRTGEKIYCTRF